MNMTTVAQPALFAAQASSAPKFGRAATTEEKEKVLEALKSEGLTQDTVNVDTVNVLEIQKNFFKRHVSAFKQGFESGKNLVTAIFDDPSSLKKYFASYTKYDTKKLADKYAKKAEKKAAKQIAKGKMEDVRFVRVSDTELIHFYKLDGKLAEQF